MRYYQIVELGKVSQPAHSFGFGTVSVPALRHRGYDLYDFDDVSRPVALVRS